MNRSALKFISLLIFALLMGGCATPNRLVYSGGFSFANFDYIVIGKPDSMGTNTSLYGMDVEFANLMSRYGMKVVGDKEYEGLDTLKKTRTLFARMSLEASQRRINLSITFDDAITGKAVASISTFSKGNILKADARTKAFEKASETLIYSLEREKGLYIQDQK